MDVTKLCVDTTRELRGKYYTHANVQCERDDIPFGGSIRESIGPFPEFILKGRFCARSAKGYCTPCFYSRLPEHAIPNQQYDDGYLNQVDYIVDHFDDLVINNQVGKVAFPRSIERPVCALVCTPTGSYFDDVEYPVAVRRQNLKKLYEISVSKNVELALHIESHAEDVINYFSSPDEEELKLLKLLNARVILGFESVDELSRNYVYAKHLSLDVFENAVQTLKKYGFGVGAFVFAGLFPFTEMETIEDTNKTFEYLKHNGVSPVIMFANTQKYTIPDVLLRLGKYKLLDPRTVLRIVQNMIRIFGSDMTNAIDPWLIADPKGGPPDPNLHIFNSSTSTACSTCASRIYDAIERLRITKDVELFLKECSSIDSCECRINYDDLLKRQKEIQSINLLGRIEELVNEARANEDYYLLLENSWRVKAELLCYGLRLDNEQMEIAKRFNPYINEKGFAHAVHISYKGLLINICVAEEFCKNSPYSALYYDGQWHLLKDSKDLGSFDFLKMPDWIHKKVGNYLIGDIIRPHSDSCLSLWPYSVCAYVQQGKGCNFCCLNSSNPGYCIDAKVVVDMLDNILSLNPDYDINLSGGVLSSPDQTLDFYSDISRKITGKHGEISISVECVPPSSTKKLIDLKSSGVSSIIMNIEIYDDGLRKKICPGKSEIALEYYLKMLKEAVSIFGYGNVSSVLIVGIQPEADIRVACKKLVGIGVIPTLMPFKPFDNTPMSEYKLTDANEYIRLSRYLSNIMKTKDLCINSRSGCASCGACSLEINLSEV